MVKGCEREEEVKVKVEGEEGKGYLLALGLLRRCAKIVATCEAEKGWIEKYLGKRCPVVEVTDIKRFFKLVSGGVESGELEVGEWVSLGVEE